VRELHVVCEGQTEEIFCNQVLYRHLFPQQDVRFVTILVAHSKRHGKVNRGGVPERYETMRRDIVNTLKSRHKQDAFVTTMIDLYALPSDFPGKTIHHRNPDDPTPYVKALEEAFGNDIAEAFGDDNAHSRFIPYLQLHEYETMLFADPEAFRIAFDDCDRAIVQLKTIAGLFPSIEHIDDGPTTAPSKRIINVIPGYEDRKTSAGPDVAEFIGLAAIRDKCPHFDQWLSRLEGLRK
jgi:Domain of unknown function (DUF4276)